MTRMLTRKKLVSFASALLCVVAWVGSRSHAQLPAVGAAEGFDANEYFPAPDSTLLHWRITGVKAEPLDRARALLSGMKLQMFLKNGETELAVDAAECLYDSAKRIASSPGKLKVLVNEGRFVIEGEGFLWQQTQETNWTLTISNQVHATVQRPTTNAATSLMTITSRQFAFDTFQREGVFRENVHAEDSEIELACAVLSATTSTNSGAPDTLKAERNVSVDSKTDELSARADLAFYSRTNETLVLTGNVSWKKGAQAGSAERVVLQRLEKQFTAAGTVAVQLPRGSLGLGGLLPADSSTVNAATNISAPLQLSARHLLVSSNLTVIEGEVRIQDETNRLACDKIVVATEGKEQTAVAEGHVIVCHGDADQCLRADRAAHTKSTGAAVFTGQPAWKVAQSEGRADQVTLRDAGEIHALGNVAARVTLAGQFNSFLNLFPSPANTNQATRALELFSRELTASKSQVTLSGDARVHQSPINGREPHLRCETLTLHFATNSSHVELMQANDQVRFEQGITGVTNGPDAHSLLTASRLIATCEPTNGALVRLVAEGGVQAEQPGSVAKSERATYMAATEIMELTGQPTLRTTAAAIAGAEKITWDRKRNRVSATGLFDGTAQTGALKQIITPPKAPTP